MNKTVGILFFVAAVFAITGVAVAPMLLELPNAEAQKQCPDNPNSACPYTPGHGATPPGQGGIPPGIAKKLP